MPAMDGQTLYSQDPGVQQMFVDAYGPAATAVWEQQHNTEIMPTPPQSNPVQVAPSGAVTYVNSGQTQGPMGGGGDNGGGGGGGGGPSDYERLLADNAARQAAADAADLAYRQAMLKFNNDQLALTAARDAWAKEYQTQTMGLNVLQLGAGMRGPANYLQYARTMSNTPGGLKDAVNALAGRYGLSRQQGTIPGSQFQRQTLGTLVNDINGGAAQELGGDLSGVPLPGGSQWNAKNFGVLAQNPTQVGLLQSLYEESGRDWNTELANYQSSLPKYSGANAARIQLG